MHRLKHEGVFTMALVFLLVSTVMAEPLDEKSKTVTIPLGEIWATQMPGTKKFSELNTQQPLVYEIREAIGFTQSDKDAKPAFAVLGRDLDALREAHAVFVDKKKPRDTFPPESEVSVMFFTHETGPYVHLHKVERQGNNVNIYYRFVPHEEEVTQQYIAIIPLGKLSNGKYSVNIMRSPDAGNRLQKVSDEVARRIICRPFSFTVSE